MYLVNLYSFAIILFCLGLYLALFSQDRIKKLFGLSLFQNAVLWLFISIAKQQNGIPPILSSLHEAKYSNPLPHVLMLTAIVVAITTFSLGCAFAIKLKASSQDH